ncbi:MAG: hypothetical protein ABH821_02645 [archaeon]
MAKRVKFYLSTRLQEAKKPVKTLLRKPTRDNWRNLRTAIAKKYPYFDKLPEEMRNILNNYAKELKELDTLQKTNPNNARIKE